MASPDQTQTEHIGAAAAPQSTSPVTDPGAKGTPVLPFAAMERVGDRIGRYKLLQQIGEGGCGVVYMAEQEEPVRRRVALKVIKLGMDTKSVIARFEAERQALALMDHPNIAKVLDAGATENGRPFFVMELVRGVRITEYCDQNNLSTQDRLKLFIPVCQAIQHAHQKGIIHRDIKPSNILVTSHDGQPVPKVIDFGIAKATQGRLTDQTLFTAYEQFIGTPAYMSPEQAEMSGLDVDTRSDIYALGVLLYELLTGSTPFDARELLASGIDKLRRVIREKEPERPSTRLRTMLNGDLTTTARHRQTDPPMLIHLVRGDLDWIVMKTLEKDRTRRYETANGLAMDILRHLNSEPVLARPPSSLYRLQKSVHRNRTAVVAASAVLLALLVGFTLSVYLFIQERAARQRAVAAEQEQIRLRKQAEEALAEKERLRGQAQFGEKLSAAGRLVSTGQFEEAEKLFGEIHDPAIVPLVNSVALLRAREADWPRAITNFSLLLELSPREHMPYYHLAVLLSLANDGDGYRRLCQRIATRFAGDPAPLVAERMAKACLLQPNSVPDNSVISTMVNTAMAGRARRRLPDDFKLVKGLQELRLGHFAAAIDWLPKTAAAEAEPWRSVQASMALAMAEEELGHEDEARTTLQQALQLTNSHIPRARTRDFGSAWSEWVVAQVLTREAKAMVEGTNSANLPK